LFWELILLASITLYVLLRLFSPGLSGKIRFRLIGLISLYAIVLPWIWGFRWLMVPLYLFILLFHLGFLFGRKGPPFDSRPLNHSGFLFRLRQFSLVLGLAFLWALWAFFPVPDAIKLPGSFSVAFHRFQSPLASEQGWWQIWYPTDREPWGSSARYLPRNFTSGNLLDFFQHEARNYGRSWAIEDGPGRENWQGLTPGVIFVPPRGKTAQDFTYLLEALASHGYVVLGPLGQGDAYGESRFSWPSIFGQKEEPPSLTEPLGAWEYKNALTKALEIWPGLKGKAWSVLAADRLNTLGGTPDFSKPNILLALEAPPPWTHGNLLFVRGQYNSRFRSGQNTALMMIEGWDILDFEDENLISPLAKIQGAASPVAQLEIMSYSVQVWAHYLGFQSGLEYGSLDFVDSQPFPGAWFNF